MQKDVEKKTYEKYRMQQKRKSSKKETVLMKKIIMED